MICSACAIVTGTVAAASGGYLAFKKDKSDTMKYLAIAATVFAGSLFLINVLTPSK